MVHNLLDKRKKGQKRKAPLSPGLHLVSTGWGVVGVADAAVESDSITVIIMEGTASDNVV